MRIRSLVAFVFLLSILSACGLTSGSKDPHPTVETETAKNESEKPIAKIVDSGFGNNGYSTLAVVLVSSVNKAAVGRTVIVSVNFLDAEGQILATSDQTGEFKWVGQQIPVQLGQGNLREDAKVARIEPSIAFSEIGKTGDAMAPLPVLESTEITDKAPARLTAWFSFTNETDEPLKEFLVAVVCYDKDRKIIGGGSAYPALAPVGQTIRIDSKITVSGDPESCKAHLNYPR